jgi:hypothetical protein
MRTQPAVTALLAYATYLAIACPCSRTLSCHLPHFYGAVGAASFLVAIENAP